MTAKEQDFTMTEGEAKKIEVSQTDDLDSGGDLDISGRQELRWELKLDKDDEAIIEKTASGSADMTVTDASVGAYSIYIRDSDTEGLPIIDRRKEFDFYHHVRLTDSNGRTSTLLEGNITVEAL